MTDRGLPQRRITGFFLDEHGDWVARLECGHTRHVRHRPPWQVRPWTQTEAGRASRLGRRLGCARCAQERSREAGVS